MNRTKIEWTDFTWNPVTGCWGPGGTAEKPKRCPYCYAERVAKRFPEKFEEYHGHDPFTPLLHERRLSQPAKVKKPSKIFVCSMADLFGDWVPSPWVFEILMIAEANRHHTFQFLTKNPKRLKDFNPWPSNCWVGTTVTNQADADERLPWLLQVDAPVRFVSHEPLLSGIDVQKWVRPDEIVPDSNPTGWGRNYCGISWAIIGAMTGPEAVKPSMIWTKDLIGQYRSAGVPLFLKDNLFWPENIQEFPA